MSRCPVSESRTSEAAKSNSSEARSDGDRSVIAREERRGNFRLDGNEDESVREGKHQSTWRDRGTHDLLGLLNNAVQVVLWPPQAWNAMLVIAEHFIKRCP
jgi:hypothetical protein